MNNYSRYSGKVTPCWLCYYPRPMGLEPTIYLSEPDFSNEPADDPYTRPHVVKVDSIQAGLIRILAYNDYDSYLTELKVVS